MISTQAPDDDEYGAALRDTLAFLKVTKFPTYLISDMTEADDEHPGGAQTHFRGDLEDRDEVLAFQRPYAEKALARRDGLDVKYAEILRDPKFQALLSDERMASLGLSQEMDYTCDTPGMTAHIVLYGNEEVAAVIIPDKVNVPLYLDCSPTRIGPECSDGQFTAHINTLEDKAMFSDVNDAAPLTCSMVMPEPVPETE